MKRWLLIVVLLVDFIVPARSDNVIFHNINQIFGISMRETASVCKDDNGFIWTSSKTGILRIMENDYRMYQYAKTPRIGVLLCVRDHPYLLVLLPVYMDFSRLLSCIDHHCPVRAP